MPFLLLVPAGVVLLVGLWGVALYNGLQRLRLACEHAWSDIDVQLERRRDLIPHLVDTVESYAAHERGTLEAVVQARNRATAVAGRGAAVQAGAENALTAALGRLFAVSEANPDLEANERFGRLREEITSTENKIGFARQHYNRTVSRYNERLVVFPAVIVANMFALEAREFFEVDDEAVREAPKVEF